MASREGYQLIQESDKEGTNDSISKPGPSAAPKAEDKNVNRRYTLSSPEVLEPSKDEWRLSEGIGRPKILDKHFTSSCPRLSTIEISISSSGESTSSHEDEQSSHVDEHQISNGYQSAPTNPQQMDEPRTNFWVTFKNCYNNYSRKIRNSWFIYVFQSFVGLLVASAILMGLIFFRSCEGSFPKTDPTLTILMGTFGSFLLYKWVSMVFRERSGQRFWNSEKNKLAIIFVVLLLIMGMELFSFSQMSPIDLQSTIKFKCNKVYFYYIYCLHIAVAASLVLGALLYLPDSIIYIANYRSLERTGTNGHYQPL